MFLFEGCSDDFLYLFFFFTFQIHCSYIMIANLVLILIYIYIYIYIEVVIKFFHLSLHMLFLFSLYAHAFINCMQSFICFTLRCRDEFCLKYFRNTDCQSLPCHELSSYKFFQEFVLR